MELATQKLILTEIVKGTNGIVDKTKENEALLAEFVGQELDCRYECTSTDSEGEEIQEDMYCGIFKLSDDGKKYMVERDALSNYEPVEKEKEEDATTRAEKLAVLKAKTTITI